MTNTKKRRGLGAWFFLLGVILLYLIAAVIRPQDAVQATQLSATIFQKIIPILFLIFVLLFIISLFLKPQWIKRYLGRNSGASGWLFAMLGGVLSTGPIYAWYPFLQELRQKGMRGSLIVVFLYSRSVKLPLLPLMIHYFGAMFTLILCLYLLAFSVLNGILFGKIKSNIGSI